MEYVWNTSSDMFGTWVEHALKMIWVMFGIYLVACFAHVWDMFEICLGPVWDMFGVCLDHGRDIVGTCSGHVMGQHKDKSEAIVGGPGGAVIKDAGLPRAQLGFLGSA